MVKKMSIFYFLTFLVCFSLQSIHAQTASLLDHVGTKQAIVVQIEQPSEIFDLLGGLQFLEHPSWIEVQEYLESPEFVEMSEAFGIRGRDRQQSDQVEGDALSWETVVSGPIFIAIEPGDRKNGLRWLVAFETSLEEEESLKKLASFFQVGCEISDPDSNTDIPIHDISVADACAFIHEKSFFCCSDKPFATEMLNRLHGRARVRRPLSRNRKLLQGLKRSEASKARRLGQVFIDAKLLPKLFDNIPKQFWELSRVQDISGVFIEINGPDGRSDASFQLAIDCWVGIKVPRSPIVEALLGSPPISELPDVPLDKVTDALFFSFDLKKIAEEFEAIFEKVAGDGAFETAIRNLENSERVEKGFVRNFLNGFNGSGLKFEYSSFTMQPLLILNVSDRDAASSVIGQLSEIQSKYSAIAPVKPHEEDGVEYWTWGDEEINRFLEDEKKYIKGITDETAKGVQPSAYSLNDSYAATCSSSRLKSLENIASIDISDSQGLKAIMKRVGSYDRTLDQPNLIWSTRPDFWRSYPAMMRYIANSELKRSKKTAKTIDLASYRRELVDIKKPDRLLNRLKIRITEAACGTLGNVLVVAQGEDFGFRVSTLLFSEGVEER